MSGVSELSSVELSSISVDQLARRIFEWAKRRATTSGIHRLIEYLRCQHELVGERPETPVLLKFDDAFFRLVDRGLIRWREGASYTTGNWTFTERGRTSNFGDLVVEGAEPALADLQSVIGHDIDDVLAGYIREAFGAYRDQRLTSAQICMGIVAERAAIILEAWLAQYVSMPKKPQRKAAERLADCAKALGHLKLARAELKEPITALEDSLKYLGEEYRATRNESAHPVLPPRPDDDLIAAQLRALVRTYIPAVYRLLDFPMSAGT